ncbi:MAG: FRG domain-containing protein [bacterium]|nr:FRG domain-containing protein [bacterium]
MDTYKEIRIDSWKNLVDELSSLPRTWVFRGQEDCKWGLSTTLERLNESTLDNRYERALIENSFFRVLRTNIYQYPLKKYPETKIEQLFFLQHYGAPTRLLDFSYSPYVALFFALENTGSDSALYALNISNIDKLLRIILEDELKIKIKDSIRLEYSEILDRIISKPNRWKNYVLPVYHDFHHDRSNIQQSVYLMNSQLDDTFEDALKKTLSFVNIPSEQMFIKFIIPFEFRLKALNELAKMNVNRETLFKGFEAFIKSLKTRYMLNIYDFESIIGKNQSDAS